MALFSLTVPDEDAIRKELAAGSPPAPEAQAPAAPQAPQAPQAPPAPPDPALAAAAVKSAELIMGADASPASRGKIAAMVEQFGLESMRLSADKARLLTASAVELARSGGEGGEAARGLSELQRAVRELDPSGIDFSAKGFLGLFSPVKKYFRRFEGTEGTIADLSRALARGKSSLRNDNITIRLEQSKLKEANDRLKREISLGILLDGEISRRLDPLKASGADPDKASFVEQDVLFPLRQRIIDLQQTLAVNNQGLVAMEVVSRNNAELIRGVDRALTVTLSALRTSAAVAGSLYNQRIALKKLQDLDAAAAAAGGGGGAFPGPAPGGSAATVERLKETFRDALSSLDEIERFKAGAVASMQDSVNRFKGLAESGLQEIAGAGQGRQG
ncbi:MAG: toxic anion resistance protein [Deltaproteobacteria bacterium]|jgi:uncharacterized protein YaaN involved in tellurite resistance|nr:toxic anion resistance protein [Deltaproteobacteria bacterium]